MNQLCFKIVFDSGVSNLVSTYCLRQKLMFVKPRSKRWFSNLSRKCYFPSSGCFISKRGRKIGLYACKVTFSQPESFEISFAKENQSCVAVDVQSDTLITLIANALS